MGKDKNSEKKFKSRILGEKYYFVMTIDRKHFSQRQQLIIFIFLLAYLYEPWANFGYSGSLNIRTPP